jgi:catechol 2,3-dioxygenase-like lactoylglutathione lyase family enzyme
VIFKQGEAGRATVESFGFGIDRWNARTVEAELRKRGLTPVADRDSAGFESFHVKDPDGFDVQISNGNGLATLRKTPSTATLSEPAPFESTRWKTIWLDHLSFSVTNYKESASFYMNLLGWQPTYDEGSRTSCSSATSATSSFAAAIRCRGVRARRTWGRGGSADASARSARVDHISFGISPWDTDGVKAELEKRGLRAQVDTSSRHQAPDGTWVPDEIHTAAFKSYHTQTPNGYNLQISDVTHDGRLALSNAVKPKAGK